VELTGYLAIARRWWWTLLVATWVAGLAGYVVATRIPPTYEARAQMLVGPYEGDLNTLRASGQLALTYAELVTVKPRLEAAIEERALDMEWGELRASTRVTANDTSRTLTIRVTHGDPQTAADLANTLAGLLIELVSQDTGRPEGQLQVLEFADPPTTPVAPQVSVLTGLAALAGLLGALVLVVLVEYIGGTVRSREDIGRLVPVPFLGQIEGRHSAGRKRELVVESLPASRVASSYRVVATKVAFADSGQALRRLLVVGAQAGDGSGETAANVAAVVAASGRSTVLVDADSVEAEATSLLGLESPPGLAEVMHGSHRIRDVLVDHGRNLRVMPVGRVPLEVLDAAAMAAVVGDLQEVGEVVVVVGPPVLGSAEALVHARVTDGAVVVVRRDQTKREALSHAIESLTLVGATVLGVVLDNRTGGRFQLARRTRPQPAALPGVPVPVGPEGPVPAPAVRPPAAGPARATRRARPARPRAPVED